MSFTTKNLEQLEKSLSHPSRVFLGKSGDYWKALLARLKASEALHGFIAHAAFCRFHDGRKPCDCGLWKAEETYRKSIGQDKEWLPQWKNSSLGGSYKRGLE